MDQIQEPFLDRTMSGDALNYDAQDYTEIIVTLEESILTVLISRAQDKNLYTTTLADELVRLFRLCDKDDRVRVVILTAEPTASAFCSGADISHGWGMLWEEDAEKEGLHAHRDSAGRVSLAVLGCRKVTIVAVNGNCAGGGMTAFHLGFDFRFVWARAKLTFPFVRRGIVPEGTSTYLLPRLIGLSRANSLLLTGATVYAYSKYVQDLYHGIFPTREEVYPAAKAFAKELAMSTSQISIAYTKYLLQHPGSSVEENHLLDSLAMKFTGGSMDGIEGVRSFKEKRAPHFPQVLSTGISHWLPWRHRVDVVHRKAKL